MKRPPLKLFFCYARDDVELRDRLDTHLELLRREGLIVTWHDRRISPGSEWSETIEQNLRGSDLVVFLLSNAFFASEYIAEVEMRLAIELHEAGAARVLPVLAEPVADFAGLDIAGLQALPFGPADLVPISEWDDPVRALNAVVTGVRQAAMDVIIAGGGPFEFGPHQFTEAELAALEPATRTQAMDGLQRLREAIVDTVPHRRLDENLLLGSWCFTRFGLHGALAESLFYIGQVISAFDIFALQGLSRPLEDFDNLVTILGPEWGYEITEEKEGPAGHVERFAIVYYRPRVASRHISGDVILPDRLRGPAFASRPLLLGSYRAGDFRFRLATGHLVFGIGATEGLEECADLAGYLAVVADRSGEPFCLAGNFQISGSDSPALPVFADRGFRIPLDLDGESTGDMIGFLPGAGQRARDGQSGSLHPFRSVYRDEDEGLYATARPESAKEPGYYRSSWRQSQLSSHRPLWAELDLSGT